jgi:hypothetical protein
MLSTYTINNNSINSNLDLDSNSNLDLIDPNLEENLEEDLEDNSNTINLEEEDNSNTINLEKDNSSTINLEEDNSSTINLEQEKLSINNNTIELVYKRLGYINLKAIKYLVDNTKQDFINLKDIINTRISLDNYIIYIKSKLTKNINRESNIVVKGYLDLIYIDIGRPISPKTFRGYRYYITFRDTYTKYLVIKLLKIRKDIVIVIERTIIELELEVKDNSNNNIIINLEEQELDNNNISNFKDNKVKAL